jgi:Icc-related predicted phosphoesterase
MKLKILFLALMFASAAVFSIYAAAFLHPGSPVFFRRAPDIDTKNAFVRNHRVDDSGKANVLIKAAGPCPEIVLPGFTGGTPPITVHLTNINPALFDASASRGIAFSTLDNGEIVVSGAGTFRTAPKDTAEITFVYFSDIQTGWQVARAIHDDIKRLKPDFVLCGGDLVNNPSFIRFRLIECLFSDLGVPFYVTPGNHDLENAGEDGLFERVFGQARRTFKIGGTNFILGLAPLPTLPDDEIPWLTSALDNASDAGGPIITVGHVPPLDPFNTGENLFYPKESGKIIELLKSHAVAAALYGHVHNYYESNKYGFPLIISGGGGARLRGPDPFFHYIVFRVKDGATTRELVKLPFAQRGLFHLEYWRNLLELMDYFYDEHVVAFVLALVFIVSWCVFWPLMLIPWASARLVSRPILRRAAYCALHLLVATALLAILITASRAL